MATKRIIPLHIGKGRTESTAINQIIDYVANHQKTDNGKFITGYECDTRTVDAEFLLMKRQYISATGRVRGKDDVIAYQVRQSFLPNEVTPEDANRIGVEFAKRFTKGNNAFIVCTHIDKAHIHNHIIWSAVNLQCYKKFRNFWGSTKAVRKLSDTICIENGLSIVENPKPHGKSYNKWLGDKKKIYHKELLRIAIDNALDKKPSSFDELLKLLQQSGYEINYRGKSITLKASDWKKSVRLNSTGYTIDDLISIISKFETKANKQSIKVNLLVDIQAKLQAGKGIGYERWAKVFNLKQMAQTINYLSKNGLLEYTQLEEKSKNVAENHNMLSEKIKDTEKRMSEIKILKTSIINYSKTRDVYIAYRKSGYSKKFLAENESDILLHKVAKKTFDEIGLKKLPTIKKLQSEYSALIEEKKKLYSEYRQVRDEMRQILTAKANIDRLIETDTHEHKKEKDYNQR